MTKTSTTKSRRARSSSSRPSGKLTRRVCELCNKTFGRPSDYNLHLTQAHNEPQRHMCTWPGCEHSAQELSNIKQHIKSIHMKIPAICYWNESTGEGHCGRKLSDPSSRNRHIRDQHLKPVKKEYGYYEWEVIPKRYWHIVLNLLEDEGESFGVSQPRPPGNIPGRAERITSGPSATLLEPLLASAEPSSRPSVDFAAIWQGQGESDSALEIMTPWTCDSPDVSTPGSSTSGCSTPPNDGSPQSFGALSVGGCDFTSAFGHPYYVPQARALSSAPLGHGVWSQPQVEFNPFMPSYGFQYQSHTGSWTDFPSLSQASQPLEDCPPQVFSMDDVDHILSQTPAHYNGLYPLVAPGTHWEL
ncbi:hypothetical protein NP233_g3164 [Leucocoprinus birnbaumii]|uniref:C2H2-type domain-containing protein n=1 Tax=Leucocoprinus birnbaumii TaxID=56174 RepID=A0AAD5YWN9_9AGAR|nr:hypothetical protein NP233_g3164 [Leucocoprinus birnbaumii]